MHSFLDNWPGEFHGHTSDCDVFQDAICWGFEFVDKEVSYPLLIDSLFPPDPDSGSESTPSAAQPAEAIDITTSNEGAISADMTSGAEEQPQPVDIEVDGSIFELAFEAFTQESYSPLPMETVSPVDWSVDHMSTVPETQGHFGCETQSEDTTSGYALEISASHLSPPFSHTVNSVDDMAVDSTGDVAEKHDGDVGASLSVASAPATVRELPQTTQAVPDPDPEAPKSAWRPLCFGRTPLQWRDQPFLIDFPKLDTVLAGDEHITIDPNDFRTWGRVDINKVHPKPYMCLLCHIGNRSHYSNQLSELKKHFQILDHSVPSVKCPHCNKLVTRSSSGGRHPCKRKGLTAAMAMVTAAEAEKVRIKANEKIVDDLKARRSRKIPSGKVSPVKQAKVVMKGGSAKQ